MTGQKTAWWWSGTTTAAAPFILVVTLLGRAAQNMGQTTYPLVARQLLGVSNSQLGTVTAAAGLASVLTAATLAARITRVNAVCALAGGQGLVLAALALFSLPSGIGGLWAAALVLGVGGGIVMPAAMTTIGSGPAQHRARALAVYAVSLSIGLVVGPLIESEILRLLSGSLRATFGAMLPLPLLATGLAATGAWRQRHRPLSAAGATPTTITPTTTTATAAFVPAGVDPLLPALLDDHDTDRRAGERHRRWGTAVDTPDRGGSHNPGSGAGDSDNDGGSHNPMPGDSDSHNDGDSSNAMPGVGGSDNDGGGHNPMPDVGNSHNDGDSSNAMCGAGGQNPGAAGASSIGAFRDDELVEPPGEPSELATGRRQAKPRPLLTFDAYRLALATLLTYQAPFAALLTFGALLARHVDGTSAAGASLAFAIFFAVSLGVRVLVVAASPIRHRRSTLVLAVLGTAAGIAILAAGNGIVFLVAGMAVLGAPHGFMFPTASAVLAEGVPPQALGRANARLMASANLSTIVVPFVCGWLASAVGYRLMFLSLEVPVVLFGGLLLSALRPSAQQRR